MGDHRGMRPKFAEQDLLMDAALALMDAAVALIDATLARAH